MRKGKKYGFGILGVLTFLTAFSLLSGEVSAEEKKTIYNSPYVEFGPESKAWTTCAGDRDIKWYPETTREVTGITSSLRSPEKGEHYYKEKREGEIPVGYWKVEHRPARCIHDSYPKENDFYGVTFSRQNCRTPYFSGWNAYCADCGEAIEQDYIYMSRKAAASIQYLDLLPYYYRCPFCNNLEQGIEMPEHWCKDISWNQYKVVYEANADKGSEITGYMADSIHMYQNATRYEGEEITPITTLTDCNYRRTGYVFTGWNTKADGTGDSYEDGSNIYNLSAADWRDPGTWTEKDNGKVTLYAQWKACSSTLVIDGNGGLYCGLEKYVKTDLYGSEYFLQTEFVETPSGNTISFETNGGTDVSPICGTTHLAEWIMEQPFEGELVEDHYSFVAPDGHTDRIRAGYEADPIVLPEVKKKGWSFGGWYYDRGFRQPAGGTGDRIIPEKDMTLYAQWVDLRLQAEDNYTDNERKGAVDLKWSQADARNKTYLVYQKREKGAWIRVNNAKDISSIQGVERVFTYTGSGGQYVVPYTGLYTLTAQGAQGKSYGTYTGGCGGTATGTFWLKQGEILTYCVGGQNGYNGGGNATIFGNGGGMTSVISDQKGTLLIAGGGGGAFSHGNGEPGGSAKSTGDGNMGQSGMAGGGAGYQGGTAGERIVHHHTASCDTSRSILGYVGNSDYSYRDEEGDTYYAARKSTGNVATEGFRYLRFNGCLWQIRGHNIDTDGGQLLVYNQNGLIFRRNLSDIYRYVQNEYRRAIVGNTRIEKDVSLYIKDNYDFDDGEEEYEDTDYVWLHYNEDGTVTKWEKTDDKKYTPNPSANVTSYFIPGNRRSGSRWYYGNHWYFKYDIPIPEDSTSIRIDFSIGHEMRERCSADILEATLMGRVGCGMEEGQVLQSRPAYGGSNYVNTEYAQLYQTDQGVRSGDGLFTLESRMIGYQDELQLKGVTATDQTPPCKISDHVKKEVIDERTVRVIWTEPGDRGTEYFHKVESYLRGSDSMLCQSNITENTLVSGIRGYYYCVDGVADTMVTEHNIFTEEPLAKVQTESRTKYLHVVAVDVAGNVGDTTHIALQENLIAWKLETDPLSIFSEADNTYPANAEKTWYVRADGITPFTLKNVARLLGKASEEYQPDTNIYETCLEDGKSSQNRIYTPPVKITKETVRTDAAGLSYGTVGQTLLQRYPYSYTLRSEHNRVLCNMQKFTVSGELSGKTIQIIPIAGIRKAAVFSEYNNDRKHGIFLIADGEAPQILGLDALEKTRLLDRRNGPVTVTITASDALSGIRDFYVTIHNRDNTLKRTYRPGTDGSIRIGITEEEPIFNGDFTVTGYAVDNVGNQTVKSYGTTEFALESSVKRILEPQDPVFRCGESGILEFTVWGYADRVEVIFPEEMTAYDETLNRTYDYRENPEDKITEQLMFMVPLYTPENQNLEITVRAYKGDKKLEEHPTISVIAIQGSVLEDLRTRLR